MWFPNISDIIVRNKGRPLPKKARYSHGGLSAQPLGVRTVFNKSVHFFYEFFTLPAGFFTKFFDDHR